MIIFESIEYFEKKKKYRSFFDGTASEFQGQKFPYILFFQMNHVSSKEWIALQKTFHQQSPSTIHHMIPKRFLVRILQPHVFPEKTHTLYSFIENHDLQMLKPFQGHTCFFFCQTLDEVQKFFQNYENVLPELQKTPFDFSFEEPLVLSKSLWTKSQQRRFLPLGLLERMKTPEFSFLFWNSYDVQKILRIAFREASQKISPHQELFTEVFSPALTLPVHMFHQISSFDLFKSSHPFLYHHFQLQTLLMMLSKKMLKKKRSHNLKSFFLNL